MSWIDDLFGGGRERAGRDMYNEMGNWQGGLSAYINSLMQGQDPTALYNQFAAGYKESPEALALNAQGQKAANQAAAASGMLGSGAEQTAAANLAQSVRSKDFEDYMGHLYNTRGEFLNNENSLQGMMQKYFEDRAQAKGGEDEGRAGGLSGAVGTGIDVLAHGLFGKGMFGGGNSAPGNNSAASGGGGNSIFDYLRNYVMGGGMGNSGDMSGGMPIPGMPLPF